MTISRSCQHKEECHWNLIGMISDVMGGLYMPKRKQCVKDRFQYLLLHENQRYRC